MVRNLLLADLKGTLLLFLIVAVDALVLRGCHTKHLTQRRHNLRRFDLVARAGADAVFIAARGFDDHMIAGYRAQLAGVKEIGLGVVAEADIHHRHTLRLRGLLCLLGLQLFRGGFDCLRKLCLRRLLLKKRFRQRFVCYFFCLRVQRRVRLLRGDIQFLFVHSVSHLSETKIL